MLLVSLPVKSNFFLFKLVLELIIFYFNFYFKECSRSSEFWLRKRSFFQGHLLFISPETYVAISLYYVISKYNEKLEHWKLLYQ